MRDFDAAGETKVSLHPHLVHLLKAPIVKKKKKYGSTVH